MGPALDHLDRIKELNPNVCEKKKSKGVSRTATTIFGHLAHVMVDGHLAKTF